MLNQPPPESSLFPDPESRPQHTTEQTHISVRTAVYILVAGLLAAGVTYYFGFKKSAVPDQPVVVEADNAPVKERPEQPGGIDIPYQDVTIYEKISKEGMEAPRKIERLIPPDEDTTPAKPVETKTDEGKTEPPQDNQQATAVEKKPEPAEAPEKKAEAKKEDLVKEPVKKSEPAVTEKTPPKVKEKTIESIIAEQTQTAPAATKGNFRVQLGAFPEESIAKTELARLQRKYASALGSVKLVLIRADLGSRGVFFRIQSPGITEKQAEKICADIKAAKGGCLIAKP